MYIRQKKLYLLYNIQKRIMIHFMKFNSDKNYNLKFLNKLDSLL